MKFRNNSREEENIMPCKPILDENGNMAGFVCSRGKQAPQICAVCGKAVRQTDVLCDICDKPLHMACALHIAEDTDICPGHDNEFDRARAIKRRENIGSDGEMSD